MIRAMNFAAHFAVELQGPPAAATLDVDRCAPDLSCDAVLRIFPRSPNTCRVGI